jgi:hypothetical protein
MQTFCGNLSLSDFLRFYVASPNSIILTIGPFNNKTTYKSNVIIDLLVYDRKPLNIKIAKNIAENRQWVNGYC